MYFFSGSKGFHLGLPVGCLNAEPADRFNGVARRFAESLAAGCGVNIDPAIYAKIQPFRAPNTRHSKTGLYKRRLTHGELMRLTADRIRELAGAPLVFDVPDQSPTCTVALADWRAANAEAMRAAGTTRTRTTTPHEGTDASSPPLQAGTVAFLTDGELMPGEGRKRTAFRVAANLTETGVPGAVVHQLIDGPARRHGMMPKEVEHAVRKGIAHADRKRGSA